MIEGVTVQTELFTLETKIEIENPGSDYQKVKLLRLYVSIRVSFGENSKKCVCMFE